MSKYDNVKHRVPIEIDNPSIKVNDDLCKKCQLCKKACQNDMGVLGRYNLEENGDFAVCINCGQCVVACPFNAITEVEDINRVNAALNDETKKVVFLTAPAVRVSLGDAFQMESGTNVESKMVSAIRSLGADFVLDVTLGADMTIVEEAFELVERIKSKKHLPMFTSCCPAWVKYAEMFYPEILSNLSTAKSPIAMQTSATKTYFAKKMNIDPKDLVIVVVAPCTAKKAEALRDELDAAKRINNLQEHDTDIVITTRELAMMIKTKNIDFANLPDSNFDSFFGEGSGAGVIFGNTGGVMEAALRTAYYYMEGKNPGDDFLNFTPVRGLDNVKTATIKILDNEIKVAVCHQMGVAKDYIEKIINKEEYADFIEVMACKGGCANGGGQIKILQRPKMDAARVNRNVSLYEADKKRTIRFAHENPNLKRLYEEWLEKPNSELAHELLHTSFNNKSYMIKK